MGGLTAAAVRGHLGLLTQGLCCRNRTPLLGVPGTVWQSRRAALSTRHARHAATHPCTPFTRLTQRIQRQRGSCTRCSGVQHPPAAPGPAPFLQAPVARWIWWKCRPTLWNCLRRTPESCPCLPRTAAVARRCRHACWPTWRPASGGGWHWSSRRRCCPGRLQARSFFSFLCALRWLGGVAGAAALPPSPPHRANKLMHTYIHLSIPVLLPLQLQYCLIDQLLHGPDPPTGHAGEEQVADIMRQHSALGHAEGCHPHIRCAGGRSRCLRPLPRSSPKPC